MLLDRSVASFTSSNAERFFDRQNKDFAVTDARRFGGCFDRFQNRLNELVWHHDFDANLRDKVDDIRRASVNLALTARATKPAHFRNGHALHPSGDEGILHLIELKGLNDRFDSLHAHSRTAQLFPACFRWETSRQMRFQVQLLLGRVFVAGLLVILFRLFFRTRWRADDLKGLSVVLT